MHTIHLSISLHIVPEEMDKNMKVENLAIMKNYSNKVQDLLLDILQGMFKAIGKLRIDFYMP